MDFGREPIHLPKPGFNQNLPQITEFRFSNEVSVEFKQKCDWAELAVCSAYAKDPGGKK
jgi:hypothetical protein